MYKCVNECVSLFMFQTINVSTEYTAIVQTHTYVHAYTCVHINNKHLVEFTHIYNYVHVHMSNLQPHIHV